MSIFHLFYRPSLEEQKRAYRLKRDIYDVMSNTIVLEALIKTTKNKELKKELLETWQMCKEFRIKNDLPI